MIKENPTFVRSEVYTSSNETPGMETLVSLWRIAENGPINGDRFKIAFMREIGENNDPFKITINVYEGDDDHIAVFEIESGGLIEFDYPHGQRDGIPFFDELPQSWRIQKYLEVYQRRLAKRVLSFVQEAYEKSSQLSSAH